MTEGEDIEAQVFSYVAQTWSETKVQAVAEQAMGCLDRRLLVDLTTQQARLEAGCESDTGGAVLAGDPL